MLVLLVAGAMLATQVQATSGVSLQRGQLSRQLVEAIARIAPLHSEYRDWSEKQQWFQNPSAFPELELGKLLSQLGVSGEAFLLAMKQFGEIYPALWNFPWKSDRRAARSEEDEFPHIQIFYELAVDKDMANKEELELFTRLLEEPQTLLPKAKRRIALLTEIAARGQDLIYDSAYNPSKLRSNLLRANRIGLNWETYVRIISDDPVSLADFVYMRYAVGDDKKSNKLFNALLAEYNLSRTEFDEFFAANRDNYADLSKRKDIMDKILSVVLTATPAQDQHNENVMYEKLGINASHYVGYVYEGYDLPLWAIARVEEGIGGEEKLRPQLDALLADNGMPRDEFERVFDKVGSVYSIFFPYSRDGHEMERRHLLGQLTGGNFSPLSGYFEALITKAGDVASPERARQRATILQQMLATQEPTQAFFHTRVKQLGIRDDNHALFLFIFAGKGAGGVDKERYSYLDELVNMRYAIGKDQQLNALFNELLGEYDLSRADFDEFFVANKDEYVGWHYPPSALPFREKLAETAGALD